MPTATTDTLIDLGLGFDSTHFGVRANDLALLTPLRSLEGAELDQVLERASSAFLRIAPTRAVWSATARAEVSAPIPPPDGTSPAGSHTHLLPHIVAVKQELPAWITLPSGEMASFTYFPRPAGQYEEAT